MNYWKYVVLVKDNVTRVKFILHVIRVQAIAKFTKQDIKDVIEKKIVIKNYDELLKIIKLVNSDSDRTKIILKAIEKERYIIKTCDELLNIINLVDRYYLIFDFKIYYDNKLKIISKAIETGCIIKNNDKLLNIIELVNSDSDRTNIIFKAIETGCIIKNNDELLNIIELVNSDFDRGNIIFKAIETGCIIKNNDELLLNIIELVNSDFYRTNIIFKAIETGCIIKNNDELLNIIELVNSDFYRTNIIFKAIETGCIIKNNDELLNIIELVNSDFYRTNIIFNVIETGCIIKNNDKLLNIIELVNSDFYRTNITFKAIEKGLLTPEECKILYYKKENFFQSSDHVNNMLAKSISLSALTNYFNNAIGKYIPARNEVAGSSNFKIDFGDNYEIYDQTQQNNLSKILVKTLFKETLDNENITNIYLSITKSRNIDIKNRIEKYINNVKQVIEEINANLGNNEIEILFDIKTQLQKVKGYCESISIPISNSSIKDSECKRSQFFSELITLYNNIVTELENTNHIVTELQKTISKNQKPQMIAFIKNIETQTNSALEDLKKTRVLLDRFHTSDNIYDNLLHPGSLGEIKALFNGDVNRTANSNSKNEIITLLQKQDGATKLYTAFLLSTDTCSANLASVIRIELYNSIFDTDTVNESIFKSLYENILVPFITDKNDIFDTHDGVLTQRFYKDYLIYVPTFFNLLSNNLKLINCETLGFSKYIEDILTEYANYIDKNTDTEKEKNQLKYNIEALNVFRSNIIEYLLLNNRSEQYQDIKSFFKKKVDEGRFLPYQKDFLTYAEFIDDKIVPLLKNKDDKDDIYLSMAEKTGDLEIDSDDMNKEGLSTNKINFQELENKIIIDRNSIFPSSPSTSLSSNIRCLSSNRQEICA